MDMDMDLDMEGERWAGGGGMGWGEWRGVGGGRRGSFYCQAPAWSSR